jgi:hypothetical protein
MRALNLRWLHTNVYAHPELGRRFGLHGIPVFMFFHKGKKLARHGLARLWPARGGGGQCAAQGRRQAAGGISAARQGGCCHGVFWL